MLEDPRQSSRQSVEVEANANVAPDVDESRKEAVPDDDVDWDFEGLVGLGEVEQVGFKLGFRDLQGACRMKRRKVPN